MLCIDNMDECIKYNQKEQTKPLDCEVIVQKCHMDKDQYLLKSIQSEGQDIEALNQKRRELLKKRLQDLKSVSS